MFLMHSRCIKTTMVWLLTLQCSSLTSNETGCSGGHKLTHSISEPLMQLGCHYSCSHSLIEENMLALYVSAVGKCISTLFGMILSICSTLQCKWHSYISFKKHESPLRAVQRGGWEGSTTPDFHPGDRCSLPLWNQRVLGQWYSVVFLHLFHNVVPLCISPFRCWLNGISAVTLVF